jgi:hypothetical protein
MQEHTKRLKNSIHYEVLMLLRWEILLGGKCIKRAMCKLLRWKNLVLNYSDVLGGNTSYAASLYYRFPMQYLNL